MNSQKQANVRLSSTWEKIQQLHDHTTAATVLRENGMHREFGLIAMADLQQVREEAEETVKQLAVYLVRDLNVAQVTVAEQIGVTRPTIARWVQEDEADESA